MKLFLHLDAWLAKDNANPSKHDVRVAAELEDAVRCSYEPAAARYSRNTQEAVRTLVAALETDPMRYSLLPLISSVAGIYPRVMTRYALPAARRLAKIVATNDTGQTETALEMAQRRTRDTETLIKLGIILWNAGRIVDAIGAFTVASEFSDNPLPAYFRASYEVAIGNVHAATERMKDLRDELRQPFWCWLNVLHQRTWSREKGNRELRIAFEVQPAVPSYLLQDDPDLLDAEMLVSFPGNEDADRVHGSILWRAWAMQSTDRKWLRGKVELGDDYAEANEVADV